MKALHAVFCISLALLMMLPPVHAQPYCKEGDRRICGSDVGVCEAGRSLCKDGLWQECTGSRGPDSYVDVCGNGLDDNCDGQTDENCFPWTSFVLVGMGLLFIGIGLYYMQRGKGERMASEGLAKD